MARLQRITSAGYTVEIVRECQFDKDILPQHREMKQHPIVRHAPLIPVMPCMGVEPRLWFFTTLNAKERLFNPVTSERPFTINQRIAKLRSDFRCLSVRRKAVETLFH